MNKKKAGFIRGLVKTVRSHFYDLFSSSYEEATENAKEKHNIDLPQGSVKEIIKDAIKRNKEARPDWKATKAEVQEIINSGAKQAWAAVRNDTDAIGDSAEDKFLASLDLDLDNLSDDDWKDILGDDFDEEDMGMESIEERIEAHFQGAKDYVERQMNFDPPVDEETSVSVMTDNDITAALLLFLANVDKCPNFKKIWLEHFKDIANLIEGVNHTDYPVDNIDSGDDSNLSQTKELIHEVNQEMVPVVGYGSADHDAMESEETSPAVVVEVHTIGKDEEDYETSRDTLEILDTAGATIDTLISQIVANATDDMKHCYDIWKCKLEKVASFAASIDECSPDKFLKLFREELYDTCNVCDCVNIPEEVCVYFYLGIVPTKYIDLGYKACSAYLRALDQDA